MLKRKNLIHLFGCFLLLPSILIAEELIPEENLFIYRDWLEVSISPDGKYIAGQKPVGKQEGRHRFYKQASFVLNVETGTMNIVNEMKGLRTEYVENLFWSGDHRMIVRTRLGLRAVDPDGSNLVYLTGWDKNRRDRINPELGEAGVEHLWPWDADHILLGQNAPGELVNGFHIRYLEMEEPPGGIYRMNVQTGEAEKIADIPFVFDEIILDEACMPRFVVGNPEAEQDRWGQLEDNLHTKEGSVRWFLRKSLFRIERDGNLEGPIPMQTRPENQYSYEVVFGDVSAGGEDGYPLTYLQHEENGRVAVWEKASAKAEPQVRFSHPVVDVDNIIRDRFSKKVVGVIYNDGKRQYDYWEPRLKQVHGLLKGLLPNRFNNIVSWDMGKTRFVIYSESPISAGEYYLLDLKQKSLNEILNTMPELADYTFNPMQPVKIPIRDGDEIHGYLTLPHRVERTKNLPLIVLVHGGPHLRDYWQFQSDVQFYADRGYAVLQPNFRGSNGYGLPFLRKGKRGWGLIMQDDIEDATEWAIAEGIADPDRIALAGTSFGGYSTAMGLILRPDLYQIGIAGAGVYDLVDLAQEPRRYTELGESGYLKRWLGDPENEEDMARLAETSPMKRVKEIQDPIFLWHGGDDKRARINHAYEFTQILRRIGKEFKTHWESGEGHGFQNTNRRADLYKDIEKFLHEHMPSDVLQRTKN